MECSTRATADSACDSVIRLDLTVSKYSTTSYSPDLEARTSWIQSTSEHSKFKRVLGRRCPILRPYSPTKRVPCKISSHTTSLNDMMSTHSSSFPVMPRFQRRSVSPEVRHAKAQLSRRYGIYSPQNDTVFSLLGNHASCPNWIYQQEVPRVSEELGDELSTEIDTKIERAGLQHFNSLLLAVLESEIQTSLNISRTN